LSINGTLPVICSSAVCSAHTNRIFDAAGHPDRTHKIVYASESDYESVLADCHRRKKPVIFQHQHPERERPRDLYWIDPDLLGQLNNKARLSEFVPERYVPERTVLPVSELPAFLDSSSMRPLVLKGAANMPDGGGQAVAILRTTPELDEARDRLEIGEQIVAEEFLSIEENYCVNYATDGRQTFLLGSCDQITNEAGQYKGNWISLVRRPPSEVIEVGLEIMQRAANRGYVGVAGFDIVRDSRGRILVIDLNFRLNGSTPALIWQNRLLSRSGSKSVGRVIRWGFQQTVDPDFFLLHELVESGWFFPLMIYDPQASPYGFDDVRVMGILFGSSRYQVEQRLQKLHRKFGVFKQREKDSSSKTRAA
jgi:glutathione synthase/RimK-type ligase-like ATP-grasp enzyme